MQLGLVYSKRPNQAFLRDSPSYGRIRYADSNFVGDLED